MNNTYGFNPNFCRRCSGKLSVSKTCSSCRFDNAQPLKEREVFIPVSEIRSKRFTLVLICTMIYNFCGVVLTFLFMISNPQSIIIAVLLLISVLLRALEIVLTMFVIQLEKWARTGFIIATIICGLLKIYLQRIEPWVALVFLLLIIFVMIKDWKNFR